MGLILRALTSTALAIVLHRDIVPSTNQVRALLSLFTQQQAEELPNQVVLLTHSF